LIWRFTLVLIKINYGQIGDQTGLFYTNPVFYASGNGYVNRTGTFGNLFFFHLSHRTTVIQDLLVRRQFSLVPDNRTNVNVEAWSCKSATYQALNYWNMSCLLYLGNDIHTKTYGERRLDKSAATLWNSLPQNIRHVQSVSIFKKFLKTHLFRAAYGDSICFWTLFLIIFIFGHVQSVVIF
jgi:hypothetical protein